MVRRILFFLSSILFLGCSEAVKPTALPNFFPISNNQSWEYEVTDIQYSLTQTPVINKYFLKESLTQISASSFKIEQSTKSTIEKDWKVSQVGSLQIESNRTIYNVKG